MEKIEATLKRIQRQNAELRERLRLLQEQEQGPLSEEIGNVRGIRDRGVPSGRRDEEHPSSRVIQQEPIEIEGQVPRGEVSSRALRGLSRERERERLVQYRRAREIVASGPSAEELDQQDLRATVDRALEHDHLLRLTEGRLGVPLPPSTRMWGAAGHAVGVERLIAAADVIEATIPLIPLIGEMVDAVEATTGRSWLLQRPLTSTERSLAAGGLGISLLIPFAGRLRRAANAGEMVVDIASRLGRSSQEVAETFRRLERLAPIQGTVQDALERVRRGGRLRDEHVEALRELQEALRVLQRTETATGLARLSTEARRSLTGILSSPRARNSLAAVQDTRVIRAINRFHSVPGFNQVVANYVSRVENMKRGARFVMRYVEANFSRPTGTMRFEQRRGARRITDFVVDDVRYEFKSVGEVRSSIVRGEGAGPRVGQLHRDLMDLLAQAPLSPDKLRWVFDSTRLPQGTSRREVVETLRSYLRSGIFRGHPRSADIEQWIDSIVEVWP